MCSMPDCLVQPNPQIVRTTVPGTSAVTLRICPACDTRRCEKCKASVPDPKANLCPAGHRL